MNHEELLIEVSKAVSGVANALPKLELLYGCNPKERICKAAYSEIIQ